LRNPNVRVRETFDIEDRETLPAQRSVMGAEGEPATMEDVVVHPGRAGPSAPQGARPNDDDARKPIKQKALVKHRPRRLCWSEAREAKAELVIDEELFGFLSRKALFKTRDNVTLIYLSERADRWFNQWNSSNFTDSEIATIMAYTVAAVMTVPVAEQQAWHHMGSLVAQENMQNATRFARTGAIPSAGFTTWIRRHAVEIQAFFGTVRRRVPVVAPSTPP